MAATPEALGWQKTDLGCMIVPALTTITRREVLMADRLDERDRERAWPALPLEAWKDTYATLHMWTQMVGKIRLQLTPKLNHWWNVPLYVKDRKSTRLNSSHMSISYAVF